MIRHILKLMWQRKGENAFIFIEIILSFLILFAVFSFVFNQLQRYKIPLGYDLENTWRVNMNSFAFANKDSAYVVSLKRNLKRAIKEMPGVEVVAFESFMGPYKGSRSTTKNDKDGFIYETDIVWGDEDYMEVYGIQMSEGRWFAESDLRSGINPTVVTKKSVEKNLQDTTVMDLELSLYGGSTIVGVAEHFKYRGAFEEEDPVTFLLLEEDSPEFPSTVVVKTAPTVAGSFEKDLSDLVGKTIGSYDSTISKIQNVANVKDRAVWVPIIGFLLLATFLIINVALGLFAVLKRNINKRRAEIGLRMCLGAKKSKIASSFTLESIMLYVFAIVIGLLLAVQFPLFKVFDLSSAVYYLAMLAAAALIGLVVLLCSFIPSRQAAKVEPAVALHNQ